MHLDFVLLRRGLTRVAVLGILILILSAVGLGLPMPSSDALVIHETLASGDTLHKALRTLKDNRGYSWQAIAFTQIHPDPTRPNSDSSVYLRLVGFPGSVSVDRALPLIVAPPVGQPLMLADVSDMIFKDGLPPQPNVAQYRLNDVLDLLSAPKPLQLTLPTINGDERDLRIPRAVVAEWLTIQSCTLASCNPT